jgi:hypothetical protein
MWSTVGFRFRGGDKILIYSPTSTPTSGSYQTSQPTLPRAFPGGKGCGSVPWSWRTESVQGAAGLEGCASVPSSWRTDSAQDTARLGGCVSVPWSWRTDSEQNAADSEGCGSVPWSWRNFKWKMRRISCHTRFHLTLSTMSVNEQLKCWVTLTLWWT